MSDAEELKIGNGQVVKAIIDGILASIDFEQFREPAKALALKAFDDYIAPKDFPNVPNFIEPAIKAAVRGQIPGLVDGVFDAIKARKAAGGSTDAPTAKDAFDFLVAPKAE